LRAAADRSAAVRFLAAAFVCRESAAVLAALRPSRLSAESVARERFGEGAFAPFAPTALSC
jgi:hypothetical protein